MAKAIALATLATLGLAGGGVDPARAVQPQGATRIDVASPELRAAVSRALAGLDRSLVRRVRIGAPPAGLAPARGRLPANALWIYVDAIGPNDGPRAVRALWVAELLAGAVHDIAASKGLLPIAGMSVQPVWANGDPSGECCYGRELSWRSPTRGGARTQGAIRAEIVAAISRSPLKLKVNSITFQRPLGLAVEIDMTVRTGVRGNALRRAIRPLIDHARYDGVLYHLHVPGRLIDTYGLASRARTTMGAFGERDEVASLRIPPKIWVKALLDRQPIVTHPVRTTLDIESPALRSAAGRVLGGLDSSLIREVGVAGPPDSADSRGRRPPPANALWLYVETVVRGGKADAVEGEWEALLFAGALADVAASRGLPPIGGVTIDAVRPDGTAARCCPRRESALGWERNPGAVVDATPEAITAAIRANAREADVAVTSVKIRQPLGFAAEVQLTLASPTWHTATAAEHALIDRHLYEGILVKVFDRSGALVCSHAYAARAGTSATWAAPRCAQPSVHGSPLGSPVVGVSSLFVCPAADTRPSTSPASGGPVADCSIDRGAVPPAGQPLYCTANVLAKDRTVEVDLLHDGVVLGATTQRGTAAAWLQTASVAAPAAGAWECRVLIDLRVARSRSFDVG